MPSVKTVRHVSNLDVLFPVCLMLTVEKILFVTPIVSTADMSDATFLQVVKTGVGSPFPVLLTVITIHVPVAV